MDKTIILIACLALALTASAGKKPEIYSRESYGINNTGTTLSVTFQKGKEHNHPLYAIWLADENGKFIQTLYVSESIGKGMFRHASRKKGRWLAGERQRPASLPYWTYQRNIKNETGTYLPTPKQPVVDGYTGATPQMSFVMLLKTEKPLKGKYKIMLELNQSWDWNDYWTNDRFPKDLEYKTSSQPALVYSTDIDTEEKNTVYELKPIGHSHYSGLNGELYPDLNTLTTALKIAKKITVKIE